MNNNLLVLPKYEHESRVDLEHQYSILGHQGMLRIADYIYRYLEHEDILQYIKKSDDRFSLEFCKIVNSGTNIQNKIETWVLDNNKSTCAPIFNQKYDFLVETDVINVNTGFVVIDNRPNKKLSSSFKDACMFEYSNNVFVREISDTYHMSRHNDALVDCVNFYKNEAITRINNDVSLDEILAVSNRGIRYYTGLYDTN